LYAGCASINNEERIQVKFNCNKEFFYNSSLENKFSEENVNGLKEKLAEKGLKVNGDFLFMNLTSNFW